MVEITNGTLARDIPFSDLISGMLFYSPVSDEFLIYIDIRQRGQNLGVFRWGRYTPFTEFSSYLAGHFHNPNNGWRLVFLDQEHSPDEEEAYWTPNASPSDLLPGVVVGGDRWSGTTPLYHYKGLSLSLEKAILRSFYPEPDPRVPPETHIPLGQLFSSSEDGMYCAPMKDGFRLYKGGIGGFNFNDCRHLAETLNDLGLDSIQYDPWVSMIDAMGSDVGLDPGTEVRVLHRGNKSSVFKVLDLYPQSQEEYGVGLFDPLVSGENFVYALDIGDRPSVLVPGSKLWVRRSTIQDLKGGA